MSIDRPTLIELYKITLEELRHHGRIYVQVFIGLAIIIPAFLAASSFLFGEGSPISSEYILYAKRGVFGLAILLAVFFWVTIYRVDKWFKVGTQVIKNIESKLLGVEAREGTSEFEGLLVRKELNEIKVEKRFGRIRFRFYIPITVLALIALGLLLFVFMD